MPDYVRVRDKDTGHEYSEIASVVEANPDAYSVLDSDALDHNGDPLAPSFAKKSGQKATTKKESN